MKPCGFVSSGRGHIYIYIYIYLVGVQARETLDSHTASCAVKRIAPMTVILINIDKDMVTLHPHLQIPGLEEPNLETNFAVQSQNHLHCSPGWVFLIFPWYRRPSESRMQESSVLAVLMKGQQIWSCNPLIFIINVPLHLMIIYAHFAIRVSHCNVELHPGTRRFFCEVQLWQRGIVYIVSWLVGTQNQPWH